MIRSARFSVAVLFAVCAAHVALVLWIVLLRFTIVAGVRHFTINEDQMISMRYAYHMANGFGPVWNPGDRVQGYSNLGLMLVMAGIHRLGLPLEQNTLVIIAAVLLLQIALIYLLFATLHRRAGPLAAVIGALFVGFSPSIICFGVGGYESSLQALLVALALLGVLPVGSGAPSQRALLAAPPLCALAFLVRPDSILFVVFAGALLLWRVYRLELWPRSAFKFLVIAAAGGSSVLAFQHFYYGDWLPHTFRFNVDGVAYLKDFVMADGHLLLVLATTVYVVGGLVRPVVRADRL